MKKYSLLLGLCALLLTYKSEANTLEKLHRISLNKKILVSNASYLGSLYLMHQYTPKSSLVTAYAITCGAAATIKSFHTIWYNKNKGPGTEESSAILGLSWIADGADIGLLKFFNCTPVRNFFIARASQNFTSTPGPLTEEQQKQLTASVNSMLDTNSRYLAYIMMPLGLLAHVALCESER